MAEVLKINNLSFAYSKDLVLEDLDMILNTGDFAAIVGENGSGKSTLLKLILDELSPDSGEIKIFDEHVHHIKDWTRIGYVAQTPIEHEDFPATVLEVVRASLYSKMRPFEFYSKEHNQLTFEALQKVGMEDYIDRPITKLSKGQQQRVMIARVMISQPDIIFLDEPTAGVDKEATIAIYELLKSLNSIYGVTICLVTHDIYQIANYATRVISIDNKKAYDILIEDFLNNVTNNHFYNERLEEDK